VLVLDEPTNDLDLETLALLEAQLADWRGTVLLVSHDRVFLDNVVTSSLAFEGEGLVKEYVGGYEDWLRQRAVAIPTAPKPTPTWSAGASATAGSRRVETRHDMGPKKLTFNEQRELDRLPQRIEALEAEQRAISERVAGPEFYREPTADIAAALARLEVLQQELTIAYARWDELDSRA
jgi:ATP-binding cassette subfamily F protein uup